MFITIKTTGNSFADALDLHNQRLNNFEREGIDFDNMQLSKWAMRPPAAPKEICHINTFPHLVGGQTWIVSVVQYKEAEVGERKEEYLEMQ